MKNIPSGKLAAWGLSETLAAGLALFPVPASSTAGSVDRLFYFILWVSLIFFAIIIGVMVWFVIRFRHSRHAAPQPSVAHHNVLEITWTVVPGIVVGLIFFWGFVGYLDMRKPPDNSYEIQVSAKKWSWNFTYPNGHVDNHLHVPAGRPIRLVMSSQDVIHSFYVPAFRLKMDLIPGRYSTAWFTSEKPGEYTLFCAEYCGEQHSQMLAKVIVHGSGEFEKWLADAASLLDRVTPVEAGEILYQRRGCVQCHSVDGGAKVGPTFMGTFGTEQALASGESVIIDENYLRESILEPQAKVRAGYKPVMPTYQGQLKEEEIDALIAYIKSLSESKGMSR